MTISNATRASYADAALAAYLEAKGEDDDPRSNITDLMTDLLHLANREGFDGQAMTVTAIYNFNEEE